MICEMFLAWLYRFDEESIRTDRVVCLLGYIDSITWMRILLHVWKQI
jgi:hypothetical protein